MKNTCLLKNVYRNNCLHYSSNIFLIIFLRKGLQSLKSDHSTFTCIVVQFSSFKVYREWKTLSSIQRRFFTFLILCIVDGIASLKGNGGDEKSLNWEKTPIQIGLHLNPMVWSTHTSTSTKPREDVNGNSVEQFIGVVQSSLRNELYTKTPIAACLCVIPFVLFSFCKLEIYALILSIK